MSTGGVSAELATFAADGKWDDLPAEVQHAAKRSLLNGLATGLAGSRDSAIQIIAETLAPYGGPAEATLIGRPETTDILTASFINAAAMNVHDFDDTHLFTVIHPTAPVAPPVLALSQRTGCTGAEALYAIAIGIEAACRIGNAVSPGHYSRGWHITATCGVFGAALATGTLLGLNARQMLAALGGAAAQSSGLVETLGFMAKSLGVGSAARGGLTAALMARNGLDGPARPLEGKRGFLTVTGDDPDVAAVTRGLGTEWEVLKNIHKPYPCGVVLFPVIDACLALRKSSAISADEIEAVMVSGNPLLRQRADRPGVTTGREAQVSAQHAVAACFVHGAAGLPQFTDAAVREPAILGLRYRVRVAEDPACAVPGVTVSVTLKDGRVLDHVVKHARGTDNGPLSDEEIVAKLTALRDTAVPDCAPADELAARVWQFDREEDAGSILALTRPAPA